MKHYIYRDLGAILLLAVDAEDDADADKKFAQFRGYNPNDSRCVYKESKDCDSGVPGLPCAYPHSVGDKQMLVDRSRAIGLRPKKLPQIQLFPGVEPRDFHVACFYCGVMLRKTKGPDMATKDHVNPLSRGGKGLANKVPACHACNQLKGNLRLEEYRVLVAYRNGLIPIEILQQVKFKGEELTAQFSKEEQS